MFEISNMCSDVRLRLRSFESCSIPLFFGEINLEKYFLQITALELETMLSSCDFLAANEILESIMRNHLFKSRARLPWKRRFSVILPRCLSRVLCILFPSHKVAKFCICGKLRWYLTTLIFNINNFHGS